ncbi:MAG: hypothetical protein L0211_04585 [Planctomycetaceae bacterium]|nr:hypothetical protein [Planctomycetaceae bacterium]
MAEALGTYRNGRIVLDEQPNWPDGTKVLIRLLPDQGVPATDRNDDFRAALAEVNVRYRKALKKLAE